MKATLTFTFPEDKAEYKIANSANDFYCTLFDVREDLISIASDSKDELLCRQLAIIISSISDLVDAIE